MIKKIGSQWFVFNKEGMKKLSKGFHSRKQAVKRLQQIEFFKRVGG
jgi:hypothetical protein